jgi:hypothetical protein
MTAPARLYCNFCGKSQHDVAKLVDGLLVHICNECVDLYYEIVHQREAAPIVDTRAVDRLLAEIRTLVLTLESRIASLRHELGHICRPSGPAEIISFGKPKVGGTDAG